MKIDFDAILKGLDGENIPSRPPVKDEDVRNIAPLTLARACATALITPQQGDGDTPGLGYQLYTLAHRVKDGGEVDLPAEDVALLKSRVERHYMPWVVGQVWDLLEGTDAAAAVKAAGPKARARR